MWFAKITRRDGATDTARSLHETRTRLGTLTEAELPITGYDRLNVTDAVTAITTLDNTDQLNQVLHYEEAHKNRARVVSALQTHYAGLAKDITHIN